MTALINRARRAADGAYLRVLGAPTPEALARMSDLEVCELFVRKGHHARVFSMIAADADRRDREDRKQRRLERERAKREALRAAYDLYVDAAIERAAEWCRGGGLLTEAAHQAHVRPAELWSMPWSRAVRLASDELLEWWGEHGRTTYGEWKRQSRERRPDRTEVLAA
jgi:hypothetical protein